MHVFRNCFSTILSDDIHGWHGISDPQCFGSVMLSRSIL